MPSPMKVPLQDWISEQVVRDEMLLKGAFGDQMSTLRDVLGGVLSAGLTYEQLKKEAIAHVISTHRSKSIILPVVEYHRPDLDLRCIVRNNFYSWKLTVLSGKAIDLDFDGLFHTTPPIEPDYTGDPLASVYFEGFPRKLVRGYYCANHSEWSAEIWSEHDLYTTLFMIMRSFGTIKALRWNTREAHRRELGLDP